MTEAKDKVKGSYEINIKWIKTYNVYKRETCNNDIISNEMIKKR